jgi:hypothetical protein
VAVAGAAVAEAGAAASAAEPEHRRPERALIVARAQALSIALVRLGLAAIGLGAAIAFGTRPGAAAALFVLGAVLLLVAVLGGRRRRLVWLRLAEAEPLGLRATFESRRRSLVRAAYPSTIGLTVLIALALWPQPGLAALLAGILAGLGGGALEFALQLAAWERRRGARVVAEPGRKGRVFEAPR